MELENVTWPAEFILLGFFEWPELQLILFIIFLLVYLMALTANLSMIMLISSNSSLHTPMYFFLCNLSILDITLISAVIPKLLDICLNKKQSITYIGCLIQVFFFVICVVAEYILLAVMAYDRYMAICCPLRYSSLMNLKICVQLALTSWAFGLMDSLLLTGIISRYSFNKSNKINHLFCDLKSLLKLSSSKTQEAELAILVSGILFGFIPLVFILVTYFFIIHSILKIRTNEGKQKAFSTCSSHLTVITLFFGIILIMYMRPKSSYSLEQDKLLAVLYTSLIPALNPVIYSLRNKDVRGAIEKFRVEVTRKQ
ncbi:olfactory receptor 8D1-like [Mixophyes fleayi]|uniref:olfactory receptor 8D1-like n=1 Tax=Mixophyes fleayi TaxID=3061075 RepID=UPI003F4DB582